MLACVGGAGSDFDGQMGRGGGGQINLYFIIYFQCLHLCVVHAGLETV